ncbi:class I SAM-dependent methyltransferase [Deinococcus sp. KNUC1210]|uniref:class I SAM-dependent methyltransferase n=1 Tax=Deinococcus sp. KNUC1210 TaxID=2917691 RepID=UPI001EEFAEEC|nr:class I SAM-dependent methyltransferase [Deinococcus sp. KNUC1210]ULH16610.1 class I SAM-dependent methyltransferase [Deinococcus sp. KNUC1210]
MPNTPAPKHNRPKRKGPEQPNDQAPQPRTLKLGTRRAAPPSPAPAIAQAAQAYFQTYPATLPPRLETLRRGVATKAGVRGAPGIDAAQALLASTLQKDRVRGTVLDLSAMGGLIGALPGVTLRAVEASAPALAALKASGFEGVAAAPGDPLSSHWADRAPTVTLVLAGDRGNAYTEAQVIWAHASTPPGGTLYIAGDKDKGYDRYVRRAAALFGTGETIARDGGMRVGKMVRRPGITPPLPEPERYETHGLQVVGWPGVFSAGRLDKATNLLLNTLEGLDLAGQRVLDLGCGAGVIGAWAAQRGAHVTLLDADLSSVRSAEATLHASGLSGRVLHSDVDAALDDTGYDLVLSNPPFHVGRGVVLDVAAEFIAAAGRRLRPGGRLVLVANDFLPYEARLSGWQDVTALARDQGFKVLSAYTP